MICNYCEFSTWDPRRSPH